MFSSIQKKLLIYILSITTIFLVSIGILNYMWAEKVLVQVSERRAAAMAESAAARIESYLLQKGQFAWTMAQDENIHRFVKRVDTRYQDVSSDQDYQKILTTFKRIVAQDPDINIAYVAVEKTQRVYDSTEYENPPDYKVGSRPWYKAAVNARGLVFSSPYICPVTGKQVISAAVPFYGEEGELLGVAAVEILVDKVENIVSDVHLFKSGYSFILDKQGEVVACPSKDHLNMIHHSMGSGKGVNKLVSLMLEGETGWEEIVTDGVGKYVFYTPIKNLDWSLGVVVPKDEVTAAIIPLAKISLVTVLLGVIIISLCIILLTSRITRPLEEFTSIMGKVEEGDYTIRAQVESNDEIGRLGESLNHMLDKQQHLIKQVMDTAYNMGIAGHELAITIGEGSSTIPGVTDEMGAIVKKLDLEKMKQKSYEFTHSHAIRDLFEEIILLNYEQRAMTGILEDLEEDFRDLRKQITDTQQAAQIDEIIHSYYNITEQVVALSQRGEKVQMNFVDVSDYVDDLHQGITDIVNTLQIVNVQIENVAGLQSDLLKRATKTAMGLVQWSQKLLELTSRFQIIENSDMDKALPMEEKPVEEGV
ncbi:MAG TPA: HAMP domain-containing protein [Syntrophomonadaceae bacterium]|nr:HAMP domain-containing protein [Syntrophomonadaceae bacterium]